MGKRTKDKSIEEIRCKIRRLERELYRRSPHDSYEIEELDADCDYELRDFRQRDDYGSDEDDGVTNEQEAATGGHQLESVVQVPAQAIPSPVVPAVPIVLEALSVVEEYQISDEIRAVLGEAKTSDEVFGKNIPSEVSERWGKILVEGLIKEQRESLLTKILIPENFQLVKAPMLNAEVASVLTESTKNRDKRCEKLQNQLGSGIAGIANLTSELITKDISKLDIITKLSEINQILLDLHYEETMNRRRLIIPLLDKSFLNVIQGVKRNKFIFGDNLTENIKATKSIEKSSQQIKKSNHPTQPSGSSFRRPAEAVGPQGNSQALPRQSSRGGRAYPQQARYYQSRVSPLTHSSRRPPPLPSSLSNRAHQDRGRR